MHISWSQLDPVVTHANLLPCSPGLQFGPRCIEEHQFIYVVSGKGQARIGDEEYKASAGDLFYYGPRVPHLFRADESKPFTVYGVHFSLKGDLREQPLLAPVVVRNLAGFPDVSPEHELVIGSPEKRLHIPARTRDCAWAESVIAEMTTDFERYDEISGQHNRARMLLFFIRLREHLLPQAAKQDQTMRHMKQELARHAERPYERTWLKEWTHYHEDHAARLFARTYGISPHQYHLRQKLQRAKRYLASTELSISEITEQTQFGSIHYFSRMFKQHTGLSPSAFRKQSRTI